MIKTMVRIEGMMCSMCEAHICDTIRRAVPEARKVSASRKTSEASFITDDIPDVDMVKRMINDTGYICTGIITAPYERKGWFMRR